MRRIIGIDFSGAKDAGNKIWVAEGYLTKDRTFALKELFPASKLTESGAKPELAIPALRDHIGKQGAAIVGCDFPFGLSYDLVRAKDWIAFARHYKKQYKDPDSFRDALRHQTKNREFKRQTDKIALTPFNSYNLRLYRQTWWGIAEFLYPLVSAKAAAILPQQEALVGRPQIIEVCAASTLKSKSVDFYPQYKGDERSHAKAREQIIDLFIERGYLSFTDPLLRIKTIKNKGGDAIDAVIGAIAASRANLKIRASDYETIEGRVYFEL